jgi:hypothetical protein
VATDQRGVQSNALTVAPALRFDGARATLQLGGSATRFQTDVWSLGGGAAFGGSAPIGSRAALTLNASASLSRLGGSFAASYREAAILPAAQMSIRRLTLFAGARAAVGVSSQTSTTAPAFPLIPGRSSTSAISRGGAGPVVGGTLALTDAGARLGVRLERMVVSRSPVLDRSVSLDMSGGRARLGLVAGVRSSPDENAGFGSAAVSIDVTRAASLDVAAGRYPRNRLLETPAGKFFSAGVSFRVGSAASVDPALPRPSGAGPVPRGMTRLAIRAPDASRVEVAGDFNKWRLTPAIRSANGVWYADLRIEPGQYRYAFRVDRRSWLVPDGATAVDDGFGGKSAWITVRDTSTR